MADVLEVIDTLISVYGLDKNQTSQVKDEKKREKGGFSQGYIMKVENKNE